MFSWSDVNLLQVAVVLLTSLVIAKSYVIYSLFGENAQLKVNHSDAKNMQEYYRKVAEFRKAEIKVLEEMLAVYRPLAKKLVSVHTTSTHLHLKVRSDYAQDGDLNKAIGEITAILKDQL